MCVVGFQCCSNSSETQPLVGSQKTHLLFIRDFWLCLGGPMKLGFSIHRYPNLLVDKGVPLYSISECNLSDMVSVLWKSTFLAESDQPLIHSSSLLLKRFPVEQESELIPPLFFALSVTSIMASAAAAAAGAEVSAMLWPFNQPQLFNQGLICLPNKSSLVLNCRSFLFLFKRGLGGGRSLASYSFPSCPKFPILGHSGIQRVGRVWKKGQDENGGKEERNSWQLVPRHLHLKAGSISLVIIGVAHLYPWRVCLLFCEIR